MSATALKYAHRFGYGPSPLFDLPRDGAAYLDRLNAPDTAMVRFPIPSFAAFTQNLLAFQQGRRMGRNGEPEAGQVARRTALQAMNLDLDAARRAWINRTTHSQNPLLERLTTFWSDHFTVAAKSNLHRPAHPAFVDEAIRPHIAGRFSDMLRAVTTHPLMIQYLDQHISVGPNSRTGLNHDRGLNENLAREVLELHTLGVGSGYNQADVTEFAELLTGLSIRDGAFRFKPHIAEPGAEMLLGRAYGGDHRANLADILTALDDLAAHPETAAHIARKLAVHFVSDTPPDALVRDLTAAFVQSDGDLAVVTATLIDHPLALDQFGAKARQPTEFILAAIRALAPESAKISQLKRGVLHRILYAPLRAMDQPPGDAPGPDGWPEEPEAWITPIGLATRISWAMAVPRSLTPDLPDPRDFVRAVLGDLAAPRTIFAAQSAEQRWEGIGLVLASPEFNRR